MQTNRRRPKLLCGLIFLVAVAFLSLNTPQLFYEPLTLSYRIADQALLLAGLLGSILTSKLLRIAGWAGICLYILYRCSAHYRASTTLPLIQVGSSALICGCPEQLSGLPFPSFW